MTTLSASTVFPAISWNEVHGNANTADSIRKPLDSGTSGWTVGFDQEDFNAGSGDGKGAVAQETLSTALEASGSFDDTNADLIAARLTAAGTSSTLNLAGITAANGTVLSTLSQDAAISLINNALQTTAGSNSIYQSSSNNFTSNYNALTTNVFQSTSLLPEVQSALADATYGPLLQIVLADYANQYGPISTSGPMFNFLSGGTQTVSGNVLTLNAASAATVTQSVMSYLLDSRWVAANPDRNGGVAIDRLAEDVSVANTYDLSQGLSSLPMFTFSTTNGNALITPNSSGVTFSGTWVGGSASGSVAQNSLSGTLDLSGLNNEVDWNGATITMANGASATVHGYDTTTGLGFNDTLSLDGSGGTVTASGTGNTINMTGAGGLVGSGQMVVVGAQENLSYGAIVAVDTNGHETAVTGTDGTETLNSGPSGTIQNLVDWNAGGSQTQNLTSGLTNTQELVDNYSGTNGTGTLNTQTYDWNSGGSQQVVYTGLGSGVALQYNDYSGANLTGALNNQIWNWNSGGSQEAVYTGLGSGVALQYNDYSGANLTGALNNQIWNWNTGGSQEANYTSLPTNTSVLLDDYSGANLTGALNNQIYDWTSGGSQELLYTGLPSGTSLLYDDYSGANLTGTLNNQIWNWSSGGSQEALYTGLGTGISLQYNDYASANMTGTLNNQIFDKSAGGSYVDLFTGLGSGVTNEFETYSGANWTGNLEMGTINSTSGTSYDFILPSSGLLPSNMSERENFFSGVSDSGLMNTSDLYNTNGTSINISFNYNNAGQVISSLDRFYSGSTQLGVGVFNGSGAFVEGYSGGSAFAEDEGTDGYDADGGGGVDGGYGGGYELTSSAKTSGTNIGTIAQFDTQANAAPAAAAAQSAQQEVQFLAQLQAAGSSLADMPFFEAGKWGSKVITWSLASTPGTGASPFTGYLGSQYAALVQQAFSALNTPTSGVAGYTSYQSQNGVLGAERSSTRLGKGGGAAASPRCIPPREGAVVPLRRFAPDLPTRAHLPVARPAMPVPSRDRPAAGRCVPPLDPGVRANRCPDTHDLEPCPRTRARAYRRPGTHGQTSAV